MLKLNNVRVAFEDRTILKGLNLEVKKGEFLVIVGGNGEGKTTLFNAISGGALIKTGCIEIDGKNITHMPACKRSTLIASVLQDPRAATIGTMTIDENLRFACLRGGKRRFSFTHPTDMFHEKLEVLGMGLEKRLSCFVRDLSGGQRQALSLVMATLADFKVLLLDEVTSALDPKRAELVMSWIAKIIEKYHYTTLMITHNPIHARIKGARCLMLQNGTLHDL